MKHPFNFVQLEDWPKTILRFKRSRSVSELSNKSSAEKIDKFYMKDQVEDVFASFKLKEDAKKNYIKVVEWFKGHFVVKRHR